jgi:hypothetical protein
MRRHLIIAVKANSGFDYCTIIREQEAIEVLQCMESIGIPAWLEYDNVPDEIEIPEHFDWVMFIKDYRRITRI